MTSPIPTLPTVDRAAVWQKVPTTDPVAFIVIHDGYVIPPEEGGDPQAAADYVEANDIPVSPYLTYYAATTGDYPPPVSGSAHYPHLQYLRRFVAPGRGVQCHARTHVDFTGVEPPGTGIPLPYDKQLNEISKGRGFLARGDMFGAPAPTQFCPPYGRWNDDTRRAAFTAGFKVMTLWTHTYNDMILGKPVRNGDILMYHFNADLLAQLQVAVELATTWGLELAFIEDYVQ